MDYKAKYGELLEQIEIFINELLDEGFVANVKFSPEERERQKKAALKTAKRIKGTGLTKAKKDSEETSADELKKYASESFEFLMKCIEESKKEDTPKSITESFNYTELRNSVFKIK